MKRENFADRLTTPQVHLIWDELNIPWREYHKEGNEWINMPEFHPFWGGVSLHAVHGGFKNHYPIGIREKYKREGGDGIPEGGDIVDLVKVMKFGLNDQDKAIRWIKDILNSNKSRSAVHVFHVDDAIKYGVKGAVILQNIRTWLDVNLAKKHNLREGRVWTYNKREAFNDYHPYLTEHQVRYQLEKLEEAGILISKRLDKHKWDQVLWYSINEPKYTFKANEPNCGNPQIELSKSANEN